MSGFWDWFGENAHNPLVDLYNAGGGFRDWIDSLNGYDVPGPGDQNDPTLKILIDFATNGPLPVSWSASPEQIKQFEYLFTNLPGYGDWVRARDNFNYITDYLRNNGMSWSDMLYPSRVTGSGSSPYGSLNFYSSNIKKLYQ